MEEVFREVLLRGVYSRLNRTPLARRKIAFLGENLDFWDFMNLIETKPTYKRTSSSNFDPIFPF
jgi:hypothetical protein